MPLPHPTDYGYVRSAISIDLDETALPDSVIRSPLYAGRVEAEITERVPGWAALDPITDVVALGRIRRAAIALTAALLVQAIPQLTAERSSDGQSYTRKAIDPVVLAASLRAQAEGELAVVLGTETTATQPVAFVLARGRRGR